MILFIYFINLVISFFFPLKHLILLKTRIYIYKILRINEKSGKDKNTKKELWSWDQRGYYVSPMSTSWHNFVSDLLATNAKENMITYMIQHCHKIFNAILSEATKIFLTLVLKITYFSYEKNTMEYSEDPQNLYSSHKREVRWYTETRWHIDRSLNRWPGIGV